MYREVADMNRCLVRRRNLCVAALLIVAVLALAGCGGGEDEAAAGDDPARVEAVAGTDDLHRVILTAEAAERLDVQTVPVGEGEGEGMAQRTVVPYAAVLYETNGETWAYTSPEPLTFVRHRIVVESIDGDRAVLSEGPPAGTEVVTVGVAELFGAEYGVGGDEGH
jgi:hypothetical protein